MQGYFQDPEKTAGAIDEQGWLATRDYGRLTANGDLQLMRNRRR
jgi:long-subunit acyl-CoA synthetase (AMP-forming)